MKLGLVILLLLGIWAAPTQAQDGLVPPAYVFWESQDRDIGELIFLDAVTGEERRIPVSGERFTIFQDGIMYFDTIARQVVFVRRDGVIEPHPFVRLPTGARRIDWVLSSDNRKIAWTVTMTDDVDRLMTQTRVANIDGSNEELVLVQTDEANNRLRALPVAFSQDNLTLYMDTHPDGISSFIAFNQYVALFALDLTTGETTLLPDERGSSCICGAGVHTGLFLRLRLRVGDVGGFDMHIYDLISDTVDVLPALTPNNLYDTGGDVLLSPDGDYAIYALANVRDFNMSSQSVETAFMVVDTFNRTQRLLTSSPITQFVRPIAWTEDNSAVIFTSPSQNGTWKITVEDGRLERIASASYIGMIR
jgi:hypothetical protein